MSPSDYDEIYRWSTDRRTSGLWRYRGGTPSPDTVLRQLWEGVLVQYCVTTAHSNRPFGLVGLYNANQVSRYAYMLALSAPELIGSGLVLRGALDVADYGFKRFKLRKVYVESLESSLDQYRSALRIGLLTEEGRLVDHEWNGSTFEDLVFLSASDAQWAEFQQRRGKMP